MDGDSDYYEIVTKITYAGWRITYAGEEGKRGDGGQERCRDADDVKAQLPWKNKCAVWPRG